MARKHKLSRNLGLGLITLFGLGNIVGAGIYALIGKVAGESGAATPLAFLLAMLIASFSALSFAELSSEHPYSEGVSAYIQAAFRKKYLSVFVGFLMTVATIVSAATLARAFGGYLSAVTGLWIAVGSAAIILLFGFITSWGVEESLRFSAAHTIIEILGLAAIIWFGRGALGDFVLSPIKYADLSSVGVGGLFAGAFLAFYAYIGIEDMVHLSEETKKTRTTMPLAIIIAVIISTVLYVLTAVVAIYYIPTTQLESSNAPLSLVFNKITSAPAWIITMIALTATAGGVLAHVVSGSRLMYGMSEAGWIHHKLKKVHPKRRTPTFAIIIVTFCSALLAIFLDLTILAETTSYLILVVFLIVNLSLAFWKIRNRRKPNGNFKVPFFVPVLGVIFCLMLLISQSIRLLNLL